MTTDSIIVSILYKHKVQISKIMSILRLTQKSFVYKKCDFRGNYLDIFGSPKKLVNFQVFRCGFCRTGLVLNMLHVSKQTKCILSLLLTNDQQRASGDLGSLNNSFRCLDLISRCTFSCHRCCHGN